MTEPLPDNTGRPDQIAPRHVFEARTLIRVQRDERKLSLHGWVRDLSESGLRAFVADPLWLGESVIIEMPIQNADKQVIPAKVVRILGTEYGFQFTALSGEQRVQIQATLSGRPTIPRSHSATQSST